MNILAILNVSNVNDLSCDSGVIFQSLLGSASRKLGHKYSVIGPNIETFKNLNLSNLDKFYVQHGVTKYESRFKFDWAGVLSCISTFKPDVIFCNQIELTSALRALLIERSFTNIKLVSYCHFIPISGFHNNLPTVDTSLNDVNLALPILFQFLSAISSSDVFLVQSKFAKRVCLKAAKAYGLGELAERKTHVLPPPADDQLISDAHRGVPATGQVLYNHRLNRHYGTQSFYELMESAKEALSFQLVISDPMPNRGGARQRLDASPNQFLDKFALMSKTEISTKGNDRDLYRQVLLEARVSFAALRNMCPWSMASVDCMGMGVPVLAPNYAAYSEFIPSELLYDNHSEAIEKLKRLLGDNIYWEQASRNCRSMIDTLGLRSEDVAQKFINLLSEI